MSKRILIVEDERNLARFVSLELQHEGYDVVTADNGREGLEMALEKDFILFSWTLCCLRWTVSK